MSIEKLQKKEVRVEKGHLKQQKGASPDDICICFCLQIIDKRFKIC